MKLLAKLLIIIGLVCYLTAVYFIWVRNNPERLSFKNYSGNFKNVSIKNPPVRIRIQNLKIDLPIIPAKVQHSQWETTTEGASFLVTSVVPGEPGNSIIYAHDWASLFGPLLSIRRNMIVEIQYKDKTWKTFVVKGTAVVSSDQSSILEPTNDKRLTLYTCTGFLDSQRMVAIATLATSL